MASIAGLQLQRVRAGLERRIGFNDADDLAQHTYERLLRRSFEHIDSLVALLRHVARQLQIDSTRRSSCVRFQSLTTDTHENAVGACWLMSFPPSGD